MSNAIEELKIRARMLLKAVRKNQLPAITRIIKPKTAGSKTEFPPESLQLKHCLQVIAQEFGFENWNHALAILDGNSGGTNHNQPADFGTLLYPRGCSAFLNHWFASYMDAAIHRVSEGGFLLAYKRQYLVVQESYIQALGLNPFDTKWEKMGWDWARPNSISARNELYSELIRQSPRSSSH